MSGSSPDVGPVRAQATEEDGPFSRDIRPTTAITLITIRLLALAAAAVAIWTALGATSTGAGFPPSGAWAPLGLLPANLLCLWLIRRNLARRGIPVREALGYRPGAVAADLRRALGWVLVVNLPFLAAIAIMLLVMYGATAPQAALAYGFAAAAVPASAPPWLLVMAAIATVPFLLTNAPAEELVYRGYGLAGLVPRFGQMLGTAIVAMLFGAQHALFAASASGAMIYFVAFTVWGIMSSFAVRREGRLFPVLLAHLLVNALLCVPGILIPILRLFGIAIEPPT